MNRSSRFPRRNTNLADCVRAPSAHDTAQLFVIEDVINYGHKDVGVTARIAARSWEVYRRRSVQVAGQRLQLRTEHPYNAWIGWFILDRWQASSAFLGGDPIEAFPQQSFNADNVAPATPPHRRFTSAYDARAASQLFETAARCRFPRPRGSTPSRCPRWRRRLATRRCA